MTTEPDWADEEADAICDLMETTPPYFQVAAALRAAFLRGRVAGLREADSIVERGTRGQAYYTGSNAIRLAINAQADKLEGS